MNQASFIDLSVPIDTTFWEPNPVKKTIVDHKQGADLLGKSYVPELSRFKPLALLQWLKNKVISRVNHKDFPEEKGLSLHTYEITTHTGTHLDAPFHFGDIMQDGQKAKTITEIPLRWCFGHGVLLDLEDPCQSEPISKEEVLNKLDEINYTLKPFDIVLLKTGGDKGLGSSDYFTKFRGVSAEATELFIDQGIKVIGIDSFGFDPPFAKMIGDYLEYNDSRYLWPAHFLGRNKEYCHIERLTNLRAIKQPTGFLVSCFPIKLVESDASWCRVVAMDFEEIVTDLF